jgi:hypothetical protein
MFIQIEDPAEAPLPPEQVRFRDVVIQPYPDRDRVKLTFELTPFQSAPDLALEIVDQAGRVVASLVVIGAHARTLELTAHLRSRDPSDRYQLEARLTYEEIGQVDILQQSFSTRQDAEPGDG